MASRVWTVFLGATLLAGVAAQAQSPEQARAQRAALNEQAGQIFEALKPVVAEAAAGTVEVRVWRKRVGYGTVVGEGRVLAKWSEVKRDLRSLACRTGDGQWRPATVEGVYREEDLAVLKVEGLEAKPVALDGAGEVRLSQFLALARPDGEAASMGVVSVLPRSLRASDRAFLGIQMDMDHEGPGVRIVDVQPGTAAEKAGLKAGDIITGLPRRAVNGSFELSSALQRLDPGDKIRVKYRRGDEQRDTEVVLGGRSDPRRIPYSRMEQMNNMGGHTYSEVRDGFRDVIQSDMQLDPEDCGAPVVDLNGRLVGIAVARAGRIETYIIPIAAVRELLATEPTQPLVEELAARAEEIPENDPEDPFEVMRRKMEEMRRLMEEIEEMER